MVAQLLHNGSLRLLCLTITVMLKLLLQQLQFVNHWYHLPLIKGHGAQSRHLK